MGTFIQSFVILLPLLSNIISHATYFNNCSPVLCSVTPTLGIPKRCSCHQYCNLYSECCSDIINKTTFYHKQPYRSSYYSCKDADGSYYYQIDRCPPNYDVMEYVNNCENPDSDDQLQNIPAFGKTSKILYRNLYCALCHEEEFILWNLLYKCEFRPNVSFEDITSYVKNRCQSTLKPPSEDLEKYLYSCIPYISNCPHGNNNTEQRIACESQPIALIYLDKEEYFIRTKYKHFRFYKNRGCATCNGVSEVPCKVPYPKANVKVLPTVLTVLFNYHTNSIKVTDKSTAKKHTLVELPSCPKQAVYDINTNQCRQVIYHPQLNCTTTSLNESEYYITNDGRLYLNNTQRLLNQSEFIRDSQGIISICVNNGTNNISNINDISKYSVAGSYITLVGLVISIPALAITIIVYLCIPDLRTLPGKLLISLLSALFVAELLFLISSQVTTSTVLCKSLAVVMHYAFFSDFLLDECHVI
ncbi:G-protein coupled receptor Mth-like [Octopus vulgaris]|uniref:G-protein coupled receptor Mth-like n=1 Tax=Octopus vulgaris TaxID=6645 RepID=A0AA36F6H6_OCTVU|nr:G-protein coupled receptor Mth-like [Octopus vulgaris]